MSIVRSFDDLGRICIPQTIRRQFNMPLDAKIEIITTDEGILLKPYKSPEEKKKEWVGSMIKKMINDAEKRGVIYKSALAGKTTVLLRVSKYAICKIEKMSYANCSKQDKYNAEVGVAVAFAKMMNYPIPDYI